MQASFALAAVLALIISTAVPAQKPLPNECATNSEIPLHRILRPVRVARLVAPDTAPIASVASVAVSRHGQIAVLDARDYNVKLFRSDGTFRRALGRRGQGPGEFSSPSSLALVGDTLLVIVDMGRLRLVQYDTAGTLREELSLLPRPYGTILVRDDGIMVGGMNSMQGGAPSLIQEMPIMPPRDPRAVGLLPESYAGYSVMLSSPVYVAPAGSPDRVYVTWSLSNEILLMRVDGTVVQSIGLPNHKNFVDPRVVARTAPREAVFGLTSPIVSLFASAGRSYVSYMQTAKAGSASRPQRYHILDEDGTVVGTEVRGPMLAATIGDTVVTIVSVDYGAGGYDLTWMTRCK